jgi:hypothetical protein
MRVRATKTAERLAPRGIRQLTDWDMVLRRTTRWTDAVDNSVVHTGLNGKPVSKPHLGGSKIAVGQNGTIVNDIVTKPKLFGGVALRNGFGTAGAGIGL